MEIIIDFFFIWKKCDIMIWPLIEKASKDGVRFWTQGPEKMCLLENQNPSKTSEKIGYFDRIL